MYWIQILVFEKFMNIVHGCTGLEVYDTLFLLDTPDNVSNIMGCLFFEKFEFEEMKTYLEQKTSQLHKCRTKLVKKYGLWWYKQIEDNEWKAKKTAVFQEISGIHTKEELCKYMCKEQNIRWPFDTVQYKFLMIPDYSPE